MIASDAFVENFSCLKTFLIFDRGCQSSGIRFLPFSSLLEDTVAHNCHGKRINLAAKRKPHGKEKKAHGKKKKAHGKKENLTAKR